MEFLRKQPTVKAPAETFTGDAWHRHAVGQTLRVTEGRGLVRARVRRGAGAAA
jgi:hypothetical protein